MRYFKHAFIVTHAEMGLISRHLDIEEEQPSERAFLTWFTREFSRSELAFWEEDFIFFSNDDQEAVKFRLHAAPRPRLSTLANDDAAGRHGPQVTSQVRSFTGWRPSRGWSRKRWQWWYRERGGSLVVRGFGGSW